MTARKSSSKLGIHEYSTNRTKVAELSRFNTSKSGKQEHVIA